MVITSLAASIKSLGLSRLATSLAVVALLLFAPAGSFRFWEAWLFLGLMGMSWTFFFFSFLKTDPQLLARRLQREESEPAQKLFRKLFTVILLPGIVLIGLDFRFGWSRSMGAVPSFLVWTAQFGTLGAYCLVFWVMKTNTFAASTIRVESEQTVVSDGPYRFVRHPMYTGMAIAVLAIPLALASYVAVTLFALLVPLLVYRLVHEERTLRRDLRGYSEYCKQTRFRLVPWVW
jgi:protein-S-isoprenylcysteine O-methyltransferase Ste14